MDLKTNSAPIDILEDLLATRFSCRSFLPKPVDARYVRLTVTNSNGNGGSIYELQVYGGF